MHPRPEGSFGGWDEPRLAGRERREHPRYEALPVQIGHLGAIVCDVSESGIGLVLDQPMERGTRCTIELRDALGSEAGLFTAEVAWCAGVRAGLQWIELRVDQERWLQERLREWVHGGGRRLEVCPV